MTKKKGIDMLCFVRLVTADDGNFVGNAKPSVSIAYDN